MSDPKQILRSAKSILLVDWASTTIPRTLVEAGFKVFCASPGGYSLVELVSEEAAGINSTDVFPPKQNENRPENEHEGIIANHVVPLGAKVVWLQLRLLLAPRGG